MLPTTLALIALAQFGRIGTPAPPAVPLGSQNLPIVQEWLRVTIDDQHATTTHEQIFHNRSGSRLEGIYELRTVPGAEVEGFAYWNGEQKIVGEVFEKATARAIYESVRDRRRDPGLLERVDEGLFRFRVFPIEPGEKKRIQVRYSQWLPRRGVKSRYRALLKQPDALVEIHFLDERGTRELRSETHTLRVTPLDVKGAMIRATPKRRDKEITLSFEPAPEIWDLSVQVHQDPDHQGYVNIALAGPVESSDATPTSKDVTLVLDRSGSMSGKAFRHARDAAIEVVQKLPDTDRINVAFFDDHTDILFSRPQPLAQETRRKTITYIETARAKGGTNIARALTAALQSQNGDNERPKFIIFVTDGRSDASEALAAATEDSSDVRVFTVGIGDKVAKPMLTRLAAMKRGRFTYIDSTASIQKQVRAQYERISTPLLVDASIEVDGQPLQQVYPRSLPDIFLNDELRISGRLANTGPARVILRGKLDGQPVVFTKEVTITEHMRRPWVARMWAKSRVDELLEEDALSGPSSERTNEMIELAVAYNFVTPHTAFLAIPESEAIGTAKRLLMSARERKRQMLAKNRDAATLSGSLSGVLGTAGKDFASAGAGGLGIRGAGPMTGGGVGSSRGMARLGAAGSLGGGGLSYGSGVSTGKHKERGMISLSTPAVMGALSPEIIKKVINQNRNQIRYCYEVELQRNSTLKGRIVVTWVIAATGKVAKVRIKSSTMSNAKVERCLLARIKTWKFPAPAGGGIVEVNYPFVFQAQ